MNRRRYLAVLVLLVMVSSVVVVYFMMPQDEGPQDETENELTPHGFNNLNWWNIAYSLGDWGEFMTPLQVISQSFDRFNGRENSQYYVAADYVIERLEGMGIDTDYFGPHDSVLGYQEGYGTDNRAIVFGAHLDTNEDYSYPVDQNAGGCAVVTAIASILSQFRLPIDVYYCYFSYNTVFLDELHINRAMWGSREVSEYLYDNNVDVMAFYNFDQILFRDPNQAEDERLIIEHEVEATNGYHWTRYLADLLITSMNNNGQFIISAETSTRTQTDHWAFWDKGFPSVNIMSGHEINPDDPPTQSIGSPDYNTTQGSVLARSAASLAVYLAQSGNGMKTSHKIARTLKPGQTTTLYVVNSVNQTMTVHGTKASNGTLEFKLTGGAEFLSKSGVTETNFTMESSEVGFGRCKLTVKNTGNSSTRVTVFLEHESDHDGDGVLDSEEYTWSEPDPALDWDDDGLPDNEEKQAGTDIFRPDTDFDSVLDGLEVELGLDPLRDDTDEDLDGDGLSNIREIGLGTHPNMFDTDMDSMDDGWEVFYRTDALVNDSLSDPDNDTLTNIEEYEYGSDPTSSDGDNDGVSDPEEIDRGMDPLSDDSDGDGLRDHLELIEGLDPLVPDYDLDLSPDGPDHNPKVNTLIIIGLLTLIPVAIGSFFFWRRIQ